MFEESLIREKKLVMWMPYATLVSVFVQITNATLQLQRSYTKKGQEAQKNTHMMT